MDTKPDEPCERLDGPGGPDGGPGGPDGGPGGPDGGPGGRPENAGGRPRMVREVGLATLALVAVAVAVAAVVFGLILILYDPGGTLSAIA